MILAAGGTVTNGSKSSSHSLIKGSIGVDLRGPGTLINFGAIEGTGPGSVVFRSSDDVLVVEAGAAFVGRVMGDGGRLELASGVGTISSFANRNLTVSGSVAGTARLMRDDPGGNVDVRAAETTWQT